MSSTDPYSSASFADASPSTTPPTSVLWSYRLHLIGAALGLLTIVLTLLLLPATIDAAVRQTGQMLQGQSTEGLDVEAIARGTAIGSAALGIAFALIVSVLTIVFARKMIQGRNWARIVLTVFAGLQLFGVFAPFGVGLLHLLVLVAAVVLSFLPASNAWFRARKQASAPTA